MNNLKNNRTNMNWKELKPIELSKIKPIDFPEDQYYPIETKKTQLVLHHTVSGKNIQGDLNTWLGDTIRVGTHFIIDRDGTPYQLFSSKYWIHHLGVTKDILVKFGFSDVQSRNIILNQNSIGFEIDNWGWLDKQPDGKFKTCYGNVVDVPIQEYQNGFRGYKYYEKYTNAQIQTVGELLLYFRDKFGIPMDYNENIWETNKDALGGKSGIYAHCSYRFDKSDVHCQPELIDMLKSLKK
jgi:N-acetyl-anhydromuramyl-L-alanine amidase AmpD